MKKYFLLINILLFLFSLSHRAGAQTNQIVVNGRTTTPINLPTSVCGYSWFNNTPGIGLPISGDGNIPSFTAINNGSTPITATITAKPVSTGFAYLPNGSSASVSVIDLSNNSIISTIPVGLSPIGVSVTPDGKKVFITNQQSGNISVINTATNMVSTTIPTATSGNPSGIVVSPDGTRAYFANFQLNTVSVLNTTTYATLATINVGGNPFFVVISADGSRVYVSNENDGTVSVINTTTNTVVATIQVGTTPNGLILSQDGSKLYVANNISSNISVINTANNSVIATIDEATNPVDFALSPDGNKLYVTNINSNTVSVINTTTYALIATIGVGDHPVGLSLTPDGSKLYVANANAKNVSVINTSTNTLLTTLTVGLAPDAIGNFISGGAGCNTPPVIFTITINPASLTAPSITATNTTGTISACAGSPSASPNIQQFTVSGSNLTGNIIATAPAGFEISLNANSGYSSAITINQTGGTAPNTSVYVRSAASASGGISGNIVLTSPGATTENVAVTGVVNALPAIDPIQNVVYNNGDATAPINFTGIGNTFTWTNNNSFIGLPASGIGDISSFTAINNGNMPATANITVTPSYAPVAYIANNFSDNVSLINTATNAEVTPATINVGSRPWGVSLSPDYTKVYVSNNVSGTVSVINTSTNKVTATVNVGSSPEGVLVSRDGNSVYVANEMSGTVSVINTSTNIIKATIQVGTSPTHLAASPDGKTIYVSNYEPQGTISVINTASNIVTATIGSLSFPAGLAISPDGSKLYVASNAQNTVTVINTADYSVITTIPCGLACTGIAISPDGNHLYVANSGEASVSVINTPNNTVSATIGVGKTPTGICVSPDGSFACVACAGSNLVIFINTSTNAAFSVPAGNSPYSFGNFLMPAKPCIGTPATFTITVNPSPPSIKATVAIGTISACAGTPAESPNIEQFIASGNALTGDLTVVAPAGFEVSNSPGSGYSTSITLKQTVGTVNSVIIYIRSSASAPAGNISGNIVLTSPGATTQNVAVTGTVNALPTVNPVANQTVNGGAAAAGINFTGTANSFTWTNNTPGIGLPASGTGNIPSFNAINTGNTAITATIVVTPTSATGCSGTPATFTITVNAEPPGTITFGPLPVKTYGDPDFSPGATSTNNILPVTYTSGNTGVATIANGEIHITGAGTTNITASQEGNNSFGAANPVTQQLTINKAPLTLTADDKNKTVGQANPPLTFSHTPFAYNEDVSVLTTQPVLSTIATVNSAVGQYAITISDAKSPNYDIKQVAGTLTVNPAPTSIVVPNAFTPNGDGINDLWNIKSLTDFPQCLVSVYSRNGSLVFQSKGYAKPWDGTYNGSPVPTGTYYYIIDPKGGSQLLSGYVAVLR